MGDYTSLALDAAGRPAISYHDITQATLKYARVTGAGAAAQIAAWNAEVVDDADEVGSDSSLALDTAGNPHISYYDTTNGHLKYARWTAATDWQITTVDPDDGVGSYSSLKLDTADRPHISYFDSANKAIRYATWTGTAWMTQTVAAAGDVGVSALAVDKGNRPHIAYYDSASGQLKYARWSGSAWDVQTVDSGGDVGGYPALALDSSGRPHISYYDWTRFKLKYTFWTGTAWVSEAVDKAGLVGYASLALDSLGKAYLAYYDDNSGMLKYAFRRAAGTGDPGWEIGLIDSAENVGRFAALAVDRAGRPHVSYYDAANGDLKYAFGQSAGNSLYLPMVFRRSR